MVKSSIYRQLVINILIPVCLGFIIFAFYNYRYTKKGFEESYDSKNQIITSEIKHIMEFQDLALEIHEELLEVRMKDFSYALVNKYFINTQNIDKIHLTKIQEELGMNPELEDIYIIDKKGIVVNTTFRKDYNLDFFSFGEEHKKYLLDIFKSEQYVSERFTSVELVQVVPITTPAG